MRKNLSVSTLVVTFAMLTSASMAAAADNWMGAWKLNVAKSKYVTGAAPKSQTLTFVSIPAGIKLATEAVGADGTAGKGGYTAKFDGTDAPWVGNPDADTAAPKRIDANSYENVWKKGGKATITAKGVVSADGKTLTVTQTGKNLKGDAVNIVAVYDKQ